MPFKLMIFGLVAASLIASCRDPNRPEGEFLIGKPLGSISDLNSASGDSDYVALFDKTTNRIKKFKLSTMKLEQSLVVNSPSSDHQILCSAQGHFVIGFSNKDISLYNAAGDRVSSPLKIQGVPQSAAFREELNYLVVYDDLMSVSVLKLSTTGNIAASFVSGPIIEENEQLLSGDLNEAGQLLLAMSSGRIAIVDLDKTLVQQKWDAQYVDTGLGEMKWLAPVPGELDQVLLGATDRVVLYDLVTASILDEEEIYDRDISFYSKDGLPHIFYRSAKYSEVNKILYPSEGQIVTYTLPQGFQGLKQSAMDPELDRWTMILEEQDLKGATTKRLLRHRLSSLKAELAKELPAQAQLRFSKDYVFALYPSELGLARRLSIEGEEVKEAKLFNMKYLNTK